MTAKGKSKSAKKRTHSQSDSGSESEHELFYYSNDRVQLMKEVIKILKLKKIKALAPPGIKKMDMEEMNTLLLEELLGISNKRLKKILEGQSADDESSSSDEDRVDVISLDSISDDEICFVDETTDNTSYKKAKAKCRHRKRKVKKEKDLETRVKKEIKAEKDKSKADKADKPSSGLENEKLLSVLELLELQARARAIRSQLALEAESKAKEAAEAQKNAVTQDLDESDDDAIIIETPAVKEIVISSSDSENEVTTEIDTNTDKQQTQEDTDVVEVTEHVEISVNGDANSTTKEITEDIEDETTNKQRQKIKLIRSILVEPSTSTSQRITNIQSEAETNLDLNEIPLPETSNVVETSEAANSNTETSKTEEISVGEVKEQSLTDDKSEVNTDATSSKVVENVKKTDQETLNVDHDDEPDVIRLDVVEIDGIDD